MPDDFLNGPLVYFVHIHLGHFTDTDITGDGQK